MLSSLFHKLRLRGWEALLLHLSDLMSAWVGGRTIDCNEEVRRLVKKRMKQNLKIIPEEEKKLKRW